MRIAIIGGGPAGAYLGYCLAKKGVSATMFDGSHPREKPCGGGLSTFALRKFPLLRELPAGKVSGRKLLLVSPSGRQAMIEGRGEGWNVTRSSLDGFLLERALGEGARIVRDNVTGLARGKEWTLRAGNDTYKADVIVGADGVNSMARNLLAGPMEKEDLWMCYGCFTKTSKDTDGIEGVMKYFKDVMGYAWVFPRETDCSIGVCAPAALHGRIRSELEGVVRQYAGSAGVVSRWGALIPMAGTAEFFDAPACGRDWMLIGDAAGHVNPVTGEGILYALWSASLAAEALAQGRPKDYDGMWRKEYGWDLADGVRSRPFLYGGRGLEMSVLLAQRSRTFGRFLYDSINSEIRFRDMKRRLALCLPRSFAESVLPFNRPSG